MSNMSYLSSVLHQKKKELINQSWISSKYGQKDQYTVNGILFSVNKGDKYDPEILHILLGKKPTLTPNCFQIHIKLILVLTGK